MRDIRADLQQRLEFADKMKARYSGQFEAERRELDARYRQRLSSLENEIVAIRTMIDIENRRDGVAPAKAPAPELPISDFFLRLVREQGPKTKEELRNLAVEAGYFAEGENPGRSTHAVLLNLMKSQRVAEKDEQIYPVAAHGSAPSLSSVYLGNRDGVERN